MRHLRPKSTYLQTVDADQNYTYLLKYYDKTFDMFDAVHQ